MTHPTIHPTGLQAFLREWLVYDPETGLFSWRKSPSNSVKAGAPAGSINKHPNGDRRTLHVRGRRLYASRAAWIYSNGDVAPEVLIDHADGDSLNDRLSNLRIANVVQNIWNRVQREGAAMQLGVSRGERGRFKARIEIGDGRKINLGTWATEAEAHAAYMGAAAMLHGDFWIGNRTQDAA